MRQSERGFATLEVLAAVTIVAISLLSIASMFLTAQASLKRSGDSTVAVALARQIVEEMRALPFATLTELNGFDTTKPSTLPTKNPERDMARRWRYAVAGAGPGWTFTEAEMSIWPTFTETSAGMRGVIQVLSPGTSLRTVTVSMTTIGRPNDIRLATMISRTDS